MLKTLKEIGFIFACYGATALIVLLLLKIWFTICRKAPFLAEILTFLFCVYVVCGVLYCYVSLLFF
jgi:hypothetical protein